MYTVAEIFVCKKKIRSSQMFISINGMMMIVLIIANEIRMKMRCSADEDDIDGNN
uniref:Uncharacterized protein n=1 Tax=Arion vulgaris TaxID=1028688 RepID=A0A0B7BHT7_9EUPU